MASRLVFAALASASVAVAATTTTVSLYLPDAYYGASALVGSVITVEADKTAFAIGCESGTPSDQCVVGDSSWTIFQGPTTFSQSIVTTWTDYGGELDRSFGIDAAHYANPATSDFNLKTGLTTTGAYESIETGSFTSIQTDDADTEYFDDYVYMTATYIETRSCKFDEAESRARCGAAATLRFSSQGGKITSQGVAYNYQKAMLPVLITAGVEKLSAVPGATQTGTTATSTSSGGSTSSTAASDSLTPAGPTSTTKAAKDNSGNSLVRLNILLMGAAAVFGGGAALF